MPIETWIQSAWMVQGTQESILNNLHWFPQPQVKAWVIPQHGGTLLDDRPVFDTVKEAKQATEASFSILMETPGSVKDAMMEALYAQMQCILCMTRSIPYHDRLFLKEALSDFSTLCIGPESSGILMPRMLRLGSLLDTAASPGSIALISTSASLLQEAIVQTTLIGLGQSLAIDIGSGPFQWTHLSALLDTVSLDPKTKTVLCVGFQETYDWDLLCDYLKHKPLTQSFFAYVPGTYSGQHVIKTLFNQELSLIEDLTDLALLLGSKDQQKTQVS